MFSFVIEFVLICRLVCKQLGKYKGSLSLLLNLTANLRLWNSKVFSFPVTNIYELKRSSVSITTRSDVSSKVNQFNLIVKSGTFVRFLPISFIFDDKLHYTLLMFCIQIRFQNLFLFLKEITITKGFKRPGGYNVPRLLVIQILSLPIFAQLNQASRCWVL